MRVGIIGIGAISAPHIQAVLSIGDNVTAMTDIVIEKALKAKEEYNLDSSIYTDYIEMLDKENLDCVHICTPHYLHKEMVIECLKRNINVLCEKPLGISEEELDEIEEALKTTKAKLGVNLQIRYNEAVEYVKDFLKDKEVIAAEGSIIWKRDMEYYNQDAWRGKWATEGGGVMINQAIHYLDILQYLSGYPVSMISYTDNYSLKGGIEVEDTAFGVFYLKNGGSFIINATNASRFSFPYRFMFETKEGDLVVIIGEDVIINGNYIKKDNLLPLYGKKEWGSGHTLLIRDFHNSIKENREYRIGFTEGTKALRLVFKMYESKGNKLEL